MFDLTSQKLFKVNVYSTIFSEIIISMETPWKQIEINTYMDIEILKISKLYHPYR